MRYLEQRHGMIFAILVAACLTPFSNAALGSDLASNATEQSTPRADNGGLRILYPNGGEILRAGDDVAIRFDCVDPACSPDLEIVLELYRLYAVVAMITLSGSDALGDSVHVWRIPVNLSGDSLQVFIRDYQGLYQKTDQSDSFFTILPGESASHPRRNPTPRATRKPWGDGESVSMPLAGQEDGKTTIHDVYGRILTAMNTANATYMRMPARVQGIYLVRTSDFQNRRPAIICERR